MFGKSRYLGLVGTKLNVAIGLIAGLDFLYVRVEEFGMRSLTVQQPVRL